MSRAGPSRECGSIEVRGVPGLRIGLAVALRFTPPHRRAHWNPRSRDPSLSNESRSVARTQHGAGFRDLGSLIERRERSGREPSSAPSPSDAPDRARGGPERGCRLDRSGRVGSYSVARHRPAPGPIATPARRPPSRRQWRLGLIVTGGAFVEARRAAAWLVEQRRVNGDVPAVPGTSTPGWTTPHALLLWQRLDGFTSPRRLARDWLLSVKGKPIPVARGSPGPGPRHDLDRLALGSRNAFLAGADRPGDPRTQRRGMPQPSPGAAGGEGPRRSRDPRRRLELWEQRRLRPGARTQPGPTGLALLALSALEMTTHPVVAPAIAYLRHVVPTTRAAASVGWGVLGLAAHDACPSEADAWLDQAHARCVSRPDATAGLGLLLMAAAAEADRRPSRPRSSMLRSYESEDRPMKRRDFLTAAGAAAAAGLGAGLGRYRRGGPGHASVAIVDATSYDLDLATILRSGLRELGIGPGSFRGRTVVLKPNLVEPTCQAPQINTHPALIRRRPRCFGGWRRPRGPRRRGPGHCRDTELVLEQSGLGAGARRREARVRRPQSRRLFSSPTSWVTTDWNNWGSPRRFSGPI